MKANLTQSSSHTSVRSKVVAVVSQQLISWVATPPKPIPICQQISPGSQKSVPKGARPSAALKAKEIFEKMPQTMILIEHPEERQKRDKMRIQLIRKKLKSLISKGTSLVEAIMTVERQLLLKMNKNKFQGNQ